MMFLIQVAGMSLLCTVVGLGLRDRLRQSYCFFALKGARWFRLIRMPPGCMEIMESVTTERVTTERVTMERSCLLTTMRTPHRRAGGEVLSVGSLESLEWLNFVCIR